MFPKKAGANVPANGHVLAVPALCRVSRMTSALVPDEDNLGRADQGRNVFSRAFLCLQMLQLMFGCGMFTMAM